MPKKTKSSRPSSRTRSNKTKSASAHASGSHQKERELYERGVLIRGEAAKRGKDGKLPPGVTHEIAKKGDVVRVRYSMV
jgi:hypothetical protein